MKKLILTSVLVLLIHFLAAGSARADGPGLHGMLLIGTQTLYLSHLPMFHKPHDYQVILEVGLTARGGNAQAVYLSDRLKTKEKLYTVMPEQNFVLPTVVENKISFPVTLFRGHFERGGVPLLRGVMVNIKKVVYSHRFNPTDKPLPKLEYFFFGKTEFFLAHHISACPDYDQILSVKSEPAPQDFAGFLKFPARPNTLALKEGEAVQGQVEGESRGRPIKVLGQIYAETGDLVCL